MDKDIDLCGLGNGLLDITVSISQADFETLGLPKGSMYLVELDEQIELLERFAKSFTPEYSSGGSVANSIIAAAQLGSRVGFITSLGQDRYGELYKSEFEAFGASVYPPLRAGYSTGTCLVMTTPDAERTMRTCLGAAAELGPEHISKELIGRSRWLFVEGYVLANPEVGVATVEAAIRLAHANDTRVAFTFSEAWVVDVFADAIRSFAPMVDLVFANEREALSYTQKETRQAAWEELKRGFKNVALTLGSDGAQIALMGHEGHIPAFECQPVDLNGAGDMFAGSLIHAICAGLDPVRAARGSCYLAKQVISQIGARLHGQVRQSWETIVHP